MNNQEGLVFRGISGCVQANLGGEIIVLEPKLGLYFRFNGTGGYVWDMVQAGGSNLDDICSRCLSVYGEVDREAIKAFLNELERNGLIVKEVSRK